jgi:hypothetical protein
LVSIFLSLHLWINRVIACFSLSGTSNIQQEWIKPIPSSVGACSKKLRSFWVPNFLYQSNVK